MIEEPRLFIAAPLDDAARDAVEAVVAPVRAGEPEGRGVRWVRFEGLHVTLRFLGPTPESRVAGLADAIRTTATGETPMTIRISGAGAFPPHGRPRTLWLAMTDGVDRLTGVASRLDDALAEVGWARETRPFRAHLTLARADGVRAGPATAAALRQAAADIAIDAVLDRIVLFESITGSGRARYLPRAEAPFG